MTFIAITGYFLLTANLSQLSPSYHRGDSQVNKILRHVYNWYLLWAIYLNPYGIMGLYLKVHGHRPIQCNKVHVIISLIYKLYFLQSTQGLRVCLLCSALGLTGGVTKCKDDGSLGKGCHVSDKGFCESPCNSCRT